MSSNIEQIIVDLSSDPLSPLKNFRAAVEYENIGQTASAVGFYLRAAEYGHDTDPLIVYASLLRMSICFDGQKDRTWTVENCILQAISYLPDRPEAYFLLSRFYERSSKWQECYTHASLGLYFSKKRIPPLPVNVEYLGEFVLEFEKAVAAWWIGKRDESVPIFKNILNMTEATDEYRAACLSNLKQIGEL